MKAYRIIENLDQEFQLGPCTFGRYEGVQMALLKSPSIDQEKRLEVAKEFKVKVPKDTASAAETYEGLVRHLFLQKPQSFDIKQLNIAEVNRALRDFFLSISGNTLNS